MRISDWSSDVCSSDLRWCVLGANGAGKSTLLKMAAGETAPDRGSVALGASVRMGYFAQHSMDLLDGDDTIFETLETAFPDRQGGVEGKGVSGRVGFGGRRMIKKKKNKTTSVCI